MKTPKSLLEATRIFSDPEKAHSYLRDLRWPDGVIPCPKCGGVAHYYLATQKRWKCKGCKRQFSVKIGTIFEDSPIGLDKWLIAVWLITNAKNGISSCEVARALEITQKSAWFMLHRIRLAMQSGSFEKVGGKVETDETFIGGKSVNMHKRVRERKIKGTGGHGKSIVMAFLERGGDIKTAVIAHPDTKTINAQVKANVEKGSWLYTDQLSAYEGMDDWYRHYVINHAEGYVNDHIHTNGMENFWSLLKRTIRGTYVSVEPFHLTRYLDEQVFRFNSRRDNDGERFDGVASQVAGKRLTYKALIGKESAAGV